MPKHKQEIYSYYCISGFECDPSEISAAVGLEPSRIGYRGDPSAAPLIPIKENYWQLESRLSRNDMLDPETHIADVLSQLEPCLPAILKVARLYTTWIQVVGYFDGANPGVSLSKITIAKITKLECALDCDLYSLGD